ncbi:ADP-ribosylation factor family-domain-containing protein [Myxozyma melibiosi]|uniref:ADP-ribosylation factor family-domain-containing protein n=1 Tax=Myxozyma melibiosi TaxID=54550 RepID=A0ABR1FE55_9ASCO
MGLLTTLRKQKLKDKEMRILMLGLDNAGKTSIVRALLGEDVRRVSPTLGFAIRTVPRGSYTLNIWDVGGQRSLRPFWRNYYEKTDALIWVVDASATGRLRDCRAELDAVVKDDRLTGAGLLVLINKMDLLDEKERANIVDLVTKQLGLAQITNHAYKVMPCSAYTGENLDFALDWTVEEVRARLYLFD